MRELNECTAEVLRRSEKRIKKRRRSRNRILALFIPLCLAVTLWSVMILPAMLPAGRDKASNAGQNYDGESAGAADGCDGVTGVASGSADLGAVDDFSFSLTWGCHGISSYDSNTGKLVKTTDTVNREKYATTYQLTAQQKQKIYDLILKLNITSYPDTYNPHKDGLTASPSMTLILSVKAGAIEKTITAEDIALTYVSEDRDGQKFLSTCKAIRDILIQTDEWKALPEYEFFYD